MVLWGRSVLGRQRVPRKAPPRFRQGFTKVPQKVGQIRLGLPKGSAEGSAKFSPRFRGSSAKLLQVSWCLWFSGADPPLGCQEVHLGLQKGFVEGFIEVPPRFRQGCASFAIALVCHHFFTFVSQFLQFFLHLSEQSWLWGLQPQSRSWGKMIRLFFWGSFQQMAFASQQVLWSVPQTVL